MWSYDDDQNSFWSNLLVIAFTQKELLFFKVVWFYNDEIISGLQISLILTGVSYWSYCPNLSTLVFIEKKL